MLLARPLLLHSALLLTLAVLPAVAQQPDQDASYAQEGSEGVTQDDPPSRVARVSQLAGDVSVQPASVAEFSAAEVNLPMTTGDRIYAGAGAVAEIQTGQLAVRIGQNTDLTVTAMTDARAQLGLAQGSAHLRSYAISAGGITEIDTPNVAVSVLQAGDIRVDVDPNEDATIVTVLGGEVEVDGNGLQQRLQAGERATFVGSNPVSAQWMGRAGLDGLDRFSLERDQVYESAYASEASYVNPGTIGAEDLGSYGDWSSDAEFGAVWYPRGVTYDWQPYRNGHWTWIAPWGWTWVEAEPWGFAPFHYGRWNRFGNRWGWVPGPVVVRPVYSPALVVFVGGANAGVSAWFPLGPREAYVPWYHASTLYVNRVNVSNIDNRDAGRVRAIYNQRTTNVYVNNVTVNRVYVNRQTATVAMPQASFAGGRRADQNPARVRPQDLQAAQVLPHPLVTPERGMVQQAPARALPPRLARPEMASHTDAPVASQRPLQSPQASQPPRPVVQQDNGRYRPGDNRQPTQLAAQPAPAPAQQPAAQPVAARPAPAQGGMNIPMRPVGPSYPTNEMRQPAQDSQREPTRQPQPTPQPAAQPQQPRPLFNRAVPPEPRPSFDQQRQAIQQSDPGRPLGPQQLNNLRQGLPAGQPQQHEQPHPSPQPQPQRAPPPAPSAVPRSDHR